MFNKLKEKLGAFKKTIGETIDQKVGIGEKAKTLVLERELILDEGDLEKSLGDLEIALLESDVAFPVAESIIDAIKQELIGAHKKIGANTGDIVETALRNALLSVMSKEMFDFDEFIANAPKPVNIVFTGVNGTGKTTTIAKIASRLKENGYSVVVASGDTFRAGATEQIEKHAERIGVKLIKHQHGGDPAAVIYDAMQHATAQHRDVVLADTAGRMHTNINLMDQLGKICRVTPPDLVIFVDEAVAGNDAVERAREFNETVPISGSILTKVDMDSRGGAAISIAHVTGKPVLFLGTGQKYGDLMKFDAEWYVDQLF
ncbi:MAG: signal recognition particle-docking protein FtsY [Methanosarcinales archaeon]|jgi:fused signal recognition particle receptor|nr:signal recognition particle-docking protein FtsY [Methanosarcinales archaeon]MCK4652416.1 signal recognition particle-docking protein FtsY [Methanosarcinales archaeon]